MIELRDNELTFRFPDVHPLALCTIDFQRTLRIPDDNREYPLPPGLGQFPLQHVDDYAERLPASWRRHGGVFIPMYQSEALWISFAGDYPCAIKIAAGKINAVSGEIWSNGLSAEPQDYVVIPDQPWLDGFNVTKGHVRQFVAMPLGQGFTAEEQITGKAEHGGLQIIAYPMKRDVYAKYYERPNQDGDEVVMKIENLVCDSLEMGLAPGGLMRQEIYEDEFGIDAWDMNNGYRCFVHLANSEIYRAITGHKPPHKPATAEAYSDAGLPWFEYYSDGNALSGASSLGVLKSVAVKVIERDKVPMHGNDSIQPVIIKSIGASNMVRDGEF